MTQNSEINAAAHIITSQSVGRGASAALVMTLDEGKGAQALLVHPLSSFEGLTDALNELEGRGYRFPNPPTEVETGYWVIDTVRP